MASAAGMASQPSSLLIVLCAGEDTGFNRSVAGVFLPIS